MEIIEALIGDGSDARLPLEGLLSREHRHASAKILMVTQVERNLAGTVTAEARQSILDVGRITDLRGLSVAHDVDADATLLAHHLRDRAVHDAIELGARETLAAFTLEKHIDHGLLARQAPHMGGQNALITRFQLTIL
jgi:hypothetical protein